jgi:hypothetical protein
MKLQVCLFVYAPLQIWIIFKKIFFQKNKTIRSLWAVES